MTLRLHHSNLFNGKNIPHPKDPSWMGSLAREDPARGLFDLVKYLLRLARTSRLEFRRFSDAGVELDRHTLGNESLLDIALDLIGIPSDNTVEQEAIHGYPAGFFHDDTYCRDWIEDVFEVMVVEREDYDGFVECMRNPTEWIPDTWSSDDDLGSIIYVEDD